MCVSFESRWGTGWDCRAVVACLNMEFFFSLHEETNGSKLDQRPNMWRLLIKPGDSRVSYCEVCNKVNLQFGHLFYVEARGPARTSTFQARSDLALFPCYLESSRPCRIKEHVKGESQTRLAPWLVYIRAPCLGAQWTESTNTGPAVASVKCALSRSYKRVPGPFQPVTTEDWGRTQRGVWGVYACPDCS